MQIRVPRADVTDVAFEVLDVDGVEADDRREEPDVGFGWGGGGEQEGSGGLGEVRFETVKGGEELSDGFLVGFLGAGGAFC